MNAIKILKIWCAMLIFASIPQISRGDGANYVRRRIYTSNQGTVYRSETSYYDGLGRKVQTQSFGSVPGAGIVSEHTEYDAAGRPFREWLPSPMSSSPGDTIVPLSVLQQNNGSLYGGDSRPFSETVYDGSPLERVRSVEGPGQAWHSAGKEVRKRYLTTVPGNDTLKCRIFTVVPSPSDTALILQRDGWWPEGSLTVEETVDEDGRRSLVFTDLFGRKILERRHNRQEIGTLRFLDTYYVYDSGDRLVAVLPPMLSAEKVTGTTSSQWSSLTDSPMRKYAFLYLYDGRGRLKAKRLPGCGWTEYRYDVGDEPVLSQDPRQREKGEYSFILRDRRGRVCVSGVCRSAEINGGTYSRAVRSYPVMQGSPLMGYEPSGIVLDSAVVLTVNYYDDYSFKTVVPDSLVTRPFSQGSDYVADSDCGAFYDKSSDGFLTGTLTRMLDMPSGSQEYTVFVWDQGPFMWSVHYYDKKGRLIQTRRSTQRGTLETEYLAYDFTGNIVLRKLGHELFDHTAMPGTERYTYTYDDMGRLKETWHQWGSQSPLKLSDKNYDTVGRLAGESRSNGANGLQTEYGYTVRGALSSMDVGPRNTSDGGGATYTQQLCYNAGTPSLAVTPQWGGNVSGMLWRIGLSDNMHKYSFGYDALSRLKTAGYSGLEGQYTRQTEYTYDRNGNITSLIRNERNALDSLVARENLTFTYNGNRMTEVVEGTAVTPASANPPVNPGTGWVIPEPDPGPVFPGVGIVEPEQPAMVNTIELGYYSDGSLKYDDYSEIMNVSYNAIGLPSAVERGVRVIPAGMAFVPDASTWGTVSYGYSADGVKLRRREDPWNAGNNPTVLEDVVFDYIGNCIFRNDALQTVLIDGGYINAADGSYHFFVTDHLGNVRAVTDASGTIEKTFDYYPFGESYESVASANPGQDFRYGDKPKENKFGNREVYDFSARWYSPVFGRFQTMDPLCEKYYSISPYAYCANNPMNVVDPNGMDSYLLFNDGSVVLGLKNDDAFDRLYYQSSSNPDFMTVFDKSILRDLSTSWEEGFSYAVSSSYELLNVFDFVSSRTSVEWAIGSFRDNNNKKKFALVRGSSSSSVFHISAIDGIDEGRVIANLHTHIGYIEEHGASGGYRNNGKDMPVPNDRSNIINMYYRLSAKGQTLPAHYVYEVPNGVIYKYTPWKGDIFYRKYSLKSLKQAL